jgi:hypothetical protein
MRVLGVKDEPKLAGLHGGVQSAGGSETQTG